MPLCIAVFLLSGFAQAENITNTTDNTTTTIPNHTIEAIERCKVKDCTEFFGRVVDQKFLPEWTETTGVANCTFSPEVKGTLEESGYIMSCRFPWNLTPGQNLVPIPHEVLKLLDVEKVEKIKEDNIRLSTKNTIKAWAIWGFIMVSVGYAGYQFYLSRSYTAG